MKHLLVSGCSFTNDYKFKTWPRYLHDIKPDTQLYDVSFPGAGNHYIAESVIQTILTNNLDPADTLVMVMWSGVSRKDLLVSKEFYELLDPSCKTQVFGACFAHSGGQLGQWAFKEPPAVLLKPLFENLYKSSDKETMGHESLSSMVRLRDFLEQRNFSYKFMSYVNYWQDTADYIGKNLDFSLTHYNRNDPLLDNLGNNWIWVDSDYGCFYEYAKQLKQLDVDDFHPAQIVHKSFAEDIILPHVKDYFK